MDTIDKENLAPLLQPKLALQAFDPIKTFRLLSQQTATSSAFDALRSEASNIDMQRESEVQSVRSELNARQNDCQTLTTQLSAYIKLVADRSNELIAANATIDSLKTELSNRDSNTTAI